MLASTRTDALAGTSLRSGPTTVSATAVSRASHDSTSTSDAANAAEQRGGTGGESNVARACASA